MPGPRLYGDAKPQKQGFLVVVTGKLPPEQLDKFLELFTPQAAHVAEHEEGCLAYELAVSTDDPGSFIIYERYTSKEYVESVHWQSEPFKKLKEGLGGLEWVEPMAIKTYQERDVGF